MSDFQAYICGSIAIWFITFLMMLFIAALARRQD